MRTIIRKTIGLLFIAVSLTSCSKNDDCDPNDENSLCYVGIGHGETLLLTEEKTNGRTEMRFEYNDRNQVVVRYVHGVDGNIVREDFTYNGDKIIKVERKSNNQLVMTEEYFYANGDRPTTGVFKNNKGEPIANIVYAYSGNNITETSFNMEGEQTGVNAYTHDKTGKNIIKAVTSMQSIILFTLEYGDYDDNPCRYTNYPWAWKVGSVNNARSYLLTSQGPQGAVSTKSDRWEYTYNSPGYPQKAEVYDKESNTLVETREYTYKKANKL